MTTRAGVKERSDMTQPVGERVSRIEGVTEQVSERLGNLEHGQERLRADMNSGFDKLRDEINASNRRQMDLHFRWMMGALLFTLIALLGSVIGLVATVL
jgi:hypothetical protein